MSRFDYEEYYLKFKGKIFAIAENKRNAKVIGETLIQLSDENEQLKEERDYFERKKCDYQKKISILTTDKIQLKQENEQLKTQIKIFEKFLDENNLDIDWEFFCTVDECKKDSDDYGCKECKYLGVMWND